MQGAFEHRIEVGEEDIDALGHANNVAFVRWIQAVAIAHSDSVGMDFAAYVELGSFFVVRRHEVDYLRPALRGEGLRVRTWIDSAAAAKCERATEILRESDGEVLARARTTWGYVEAATGRPVRIPDSIRLAFGFPPRARAAATSVASGEAPATRAVSEEAS
jgi:acyl-CoA thioester hydrolase